MLLQTWCVENPILPTAYGAQLLHQEVRSKFAMDGAGGGEGFGGGLSFTHPHIQPSYFSQHFLEKIATGALQALAYSLKLPISICLLSLPPPQNIRILSFCYFVTMLECWESTPKPCAS